MSNMNNLKPSYTVFVYQSDINQHHNNNLFADTFESGDMAETIARERVKATNYNTGWAKVIDNHIHGKSGQSGVVLIVKKTKDGKARSCERADNFGPFCP